MNEGSVALRYCSVTCIASGAALAPSTARTPPLSLTRCTPPPSLTRRTPPPSLTRCVLLARVWPGEISVPHAHTRGGLNSVGIKYPFEFRSKCSEEVQHTLATSLGFRCTGSARDGAFAVKRKTCSDKPHTLTHFLMQNGSMSAREYVRGIWRHPEGSSSLCAIRTYRRGPSRSKCGLSRELSSPRVD